MKTRLLAFFLAALSASPLAAQEWARFRGPNGSGIGKAAVPLKWAEADFAWKVELTGVGHSSPVLWGKKLFLTSCDKATGARRVHCFDADTGREMWARTDPSAPYRTHRRNSYATSTPAADDRHLYVCWATPREVTVQALTHDGKLAWQKGLGPWKGGHGHAVSPIVHEDLLVLANDQEGSGSLIGLEKQTGEVRWTVERDPGNATYATPCVYQPAGRPAELIFTNWKHGMTSVDPKTGKVNWELSIFAPDLKERSIASPVVAGDLVLGTCGFVTAQKHLVAVRPPAKPGDRPEEVWRVKDPVAYLPTPLVLDGLVYSCTEKGFLSCRKADTGEAVWQERLRGTYSASPVAVGDRIYCTSDGGEVTVLRAGEKFEVLARNSLGGPTQSTPAVANGRIYFRTESHLIAVGGK